MAFNNRYYNNTAYSFGQGPLTDMAPYPIVAKRAPLTTDTGYQLGQLWIYSTSNAAYILVQVANNSATWNLLEASGGAGVFSSLTVNPGPINLTGALTQVGTTLINTTGTSGTTIGNATHGLTVAAGGLTVTAGGLTVTTGGAAITGNSSVTGTLGVTGLTTVNSASAVTAGGVIAMTIGGGATAPQIMVGSGAPTAAAHQGSLYLRTDGSSTTTRIYVAVDSAGTWTDIITTA